MRALILCAGEGRRLRPLTQIAPKPLARVAGEPMVVRQILSLRRAGVTAIVINAAHGARILMAELADGFGGAGDNDDLEAVVVRRLDRYFARLDGRAPHPLYDLVVHAVERPLIDYAMAMCRQNQCAAAQLLGINRNTLRKKLREHGMLSAQGTSKKFKEK